MSSAVLAFLFMEEETNEQLKRRILRDHSNPLELLESAFVDQNRLNKDSFILVLGTIKAHMPTSSITPVLLLAATLRFLAEDHINDQ